MPTPAQPRRALSRSPATICRTDGAAVVIWKVCAEWRRYARCHPHGTTGAAQLPRVELLRSSLPRRRRGRRPPKPIEKIQCASPYLYTDHSTFDASVDDAGRLFCERNPDRVSDNRYTILKMNHRTMVLALWLVLAWRARFYLCLSSRCAAAAAARAVRLASLVGIRRVSGAGLHAGVHARPRHLPGRSGHAGAAAAAALCADRSPGIIVSSAAVYYFAGGHAVRSVLRAAVRSPGGAAARADGTPRAADRHRVELLSHRARPTWSATSAER